MHWRNASFDWNRARAFLVAAEEGSFSAAARALGLAQPTLGRQVTALEEELGVTLFERVGNQLALTPTGLDLLEQARAMNEAATRFSLVADGQTQSVDGVVRIAASEAMSAFVLPAAVSKLQRLHPSLQVELVVSNKTSDLRRREADIAVRHFRPDGDDLVARMIGEGHAWLYAAPSYLERIGHPRDISELVQRAQVIGFDDSDVLQKGLRALGLPFGPESFVLRTESHLVQWELCKRGAGLCMMMQAAGDSEPAVQRVLPALCPSFKFVTWLTCHRELKTSRRIRIAFDVLAQLLTGQQ